MRIVFAGTPEFAVPVLQALLHDGREVVAVYTRPDRPSGRGRRIGESPVKQLAQRRGLPICQPASFRDSTAQADLAALRPELMIVVAYGLILPPAVLALPRLGCINVHASLLPRWRGAAPIQRAILAGDRETGVCLMQMDAGLDTGPVLASASCPVEPGDTAGRLHDRLAVLGAQLLAQSLDSIARGALKPRRQDETRACYAEKLEKAEAVIDWAIPAERSARQVRAFNPWPVAETRYRGRQLRIWAATAIDGNPPQLPGTVLAAGKAGIDVACGAGVLRLQSVQLPGARAVSGGDFANAHSLEGVRLGAA